MTAIMTPVCTLLAMVSIMLSLTLRNWDKHTAADSALVAALLLLTALFVGDFRI